MNVVPFVHEGLGNSSYLVGLPGNEALLVDPDRNVDRYLRAAADRGWRITAVLETHLHADFISGTHELGARREVDEMRLFVPAGSVARFPHQPVQAGQSHSIAGMLVEPVASPGHTPEHLSYVLRVPQSPPALFSGGSLIVGGAARTDLISPHMTDVLTRDQYRTAHHAFADLPDETLLYPTHGGGSFCSTGSGGDRTSTLGAERASNPVMTVGDEDEFARWFPETFPAAPAYFFKLRPINREGPTPTNRIPTPPRLSASEFAARRDKGALVVDVRSVDAYSQGHIPGALSNPFRDAFAVWLGWLVDLDAPLLFVLGGEPLERVVEESWLVGFERFAGVLDGGIETWAAAGYELARSEFVGGAGAREAMAAGAVAIDIRERDEFASGHVDGAVHIPLGELPERTGEVPRDRPLVLYCGHGERASSAVSILEQAGHRQLINIDGGFDAWREAGH